MCFQKAARYKAVTESQKLVTNFLGFCMLLPITHCKNLFGISVQKHPERK